MAIPPEPNLPPNSDIDERFARSRAETDNNQVVFDSAAIGGQNLNDFTLHQYPGDLGDDHYPHYVMFFINIRQSDISSFESGRLQKNVQIDQSSANRATAENAQHSAALAGAGGGAALGREISSLPGPHGLINIFQGLAGFLVDTRRLAEGIASTAGAAVGAAALNNLAKERTQVLLKDVIALYVPEPPSTEYAAAWMEEDLGAAGGLAKSIGDFLQSVEGKGISIKNPMDSFATIKGAIRTGLGGLGDAGMAAILKGSESGRGSLLGSFGGVLQSGAGITTNPFRAQLFRSMGFRRFAFNYTFLPKNPKEYESVVQILDRFKRYMHPVLGPNRYMLHYPAEFNVVYYYKDATNKELFKMSNCALTNMRVKYGGNDFTTFNETPEFSRRGAPSEIQIQLQFTELEMLTRDRVAAGF